VRRVDEYSITITGNITEQLRENIAQYVQTSCPASNSSFAQLCAAAQEQFSCIKDLDVARLPGKMAHVEISVHEPLYLVNNEHIVSHDGVLLAKNSYEPQAVQDLYQVFISGLPSLQANSGSQERVTLSPSCKQTLAQMTPDFLDRYFFAWQNDNAAWLYARENNPQLAILFHPLSLPAHAILEHCDALKQDLVLQEASKKQRTQNKQTRGWVADVRFKDQIIVSANKEAIALPAMVSKPENFNTVHGCTKRAIALCDGDKKGEAGDGTHI